MKTKIPTISVIIPAYNVGPYLGDLIDCVLRQTFCDYEIIVVNDGSTDDTQKIMDDYRNRFPGLLQTFYEKNSGQSKARNVALEHASGEYVAFLDADDIITDDYLEKLYRAVQNTDADISKCSIADFDSTPDTAWHACDVSDRTIEFDPGYIYSFHNSPCAGIIRKSFLDRYAIRFSEGEQMEDSPYGIIVNILANKVAIVNEYLYFHRVKHKSSTMTKVNEGKRNPNIPFRGMCEAAELLNRVIVDPVQRDVAEYFIINTLACFLTSMYKNYGKEIRRKLCNYCYEYIPKYFPDVKKNPYIFGEKAGNIKRIPFSQRKAVRLFVRAYQFKMLEIFSEVTAVLLRAVDI